MPANKAMLDHLLTRRSVGMAFLQEPGPNPAELEQILIAGTRVPDHGKLTPWRLIVIDGDSRAAAGAKLAEIAGRRHPEYDTAARDVETASAPPGAGDDRGGEPRGTPSQNPRIRAIAVGGQRRLQPHPRSLRLWFCCDMGDALVRV